MRGSIPCEDHLSPRVTLIDPHDLCRLYRSYVFQLDSKIFAGNVNCMNINAIIELLISIAIHSVYKLLIRYNIKAGSAETSTVFIYINLSNLQLIGDIYIYWIAVNQTRTLVDAAVLLNMNY
jgi:hypothetical protein